jgi:transposase IS116/IS110/IS902 family protein
LAKPGAGRSEPPECKTEVQPPDAAGCAAAVRRRFASPPYPRLQHVAERRQVRHTIPDLQAFVDALLARALAPAGAKDDRRDALVIGDSLRTDPGVSAGASRSPLDHSIAGVEGLGGELTRLNNQLRDLVYRSAPGLLALCPAADEPWFWAVLRAAPTPAAQRRMSARRLERLLRNHRIRRLTATQVHEVLQQPAVFTAPGVVDAVAAHLEVLLPRVELIATQRREAERQLERVLQALEQKMPTRGGPARAFGHRNRPLHARDRDPDARRGLAATGRPSVSRACMGVAPVTKQSGRRRTVSMRYGCNVRLRNAAYHWARTGAQNDPASRTCYTTPRARGHSHGRAPRSVADRPLRILMTLLSRGQIFDPNYGQQSPLSVAAGA